MCLMTYHTTQSQRVTPHTLSRTDTAPARIPDPVVSHAPPKHAVMHAIRAESQQREECEGEAARTGQDDGHAERNAN